MPYQFKLSGIDENKNKSIWINLNDKNNSNNEYDEYDDENTFLNSDSNFIRFIGEKSRKKKDVSSKIPIKNPIHKKNKIKPEAKLQIKPEANKNSVETVTNMVENMQLDELSEVDLIENKIKDLSFVEKYINKQINNTKDNTKNNTNEIIKFNKKQKEALELIRSKINTKEIITITGIAGAGKTFTILNIFSELHEITKNKTICFCAPTNNVVERSKQNKLELEKHFKTVDFCTTSTLLGEKPKFIKNGIKEFNIIERKTNKIFHFDIIVIDELSMMNIKQLNYIRENKDKIGLCILLGDKNQLNPVECNELSILDKSNINLVENMRCSKSNINCINDFIISSIEKYDENICLSKFLYDFYKTIYTYKDDKNIFVVNKKEDLIELYLSLYKKEKTIIGNYRNEECEQINKDIKDILVERENIQCIGNYFINQQIVFKEAYDEWNTSEFGTIRNIQKSKYTFIKLDYKDIITFMDDINIDKYYDKLKDYTETKYCNMYIESDKKLYKQQKILNYLIKTANINKYVKEIFKYLNIFKEVDIFLLKLNEKNGKIKIISETSEKEYRKSLENVIYKINQLQKEITKQKLKSKNLYFDLIIQGFWHMINKYREDVFAKIDSAFSCTIHRLQGCTINNICVNLFDIFRMREKKNKLKCIYTCFSRCSDKLIIYLPIEPLCNCGSYCKEFWHKKDKITMWVCKKDKKCGFMEDKLEDNENCNKCINCSKIYYKHMINSENNICYLCK